ncbi:hypothetical protein IFM89_025958 [Coptis chinensis]|uniref:TITAN-like protein n=1 Tax=Coptis chinensis TaxID=261450 RepID=A0A835HS80_9MAGN|nr:hypothetical protein IFM89_025958 [Coptis chinensis]
MWIGSTSKSYSQNQLETGFRQSQQQEEIHHNLLLQKEEIMEKKKKKTRNNYEFCKVCKLNHNQGRGHIYFPAHKKSLSLFLSNFLVKISNLKAFLENRFWCVFCDEDVLDTSFVCENGIRHLASAEHVKKVKEFMWKYGGGMDRLDSFRVSDTELAKWKSKCKVLKSATSSSSGRLNGTILGESKDIHDKIYSDNLDSTETISMHSYELSISNGFLPLQNYTNEKIQVSCPGIPEAANVGDCLRETTLLSLSAHTNVDLRSMPVKENVAKDLTVYRSNEHSSLGNCQKSSNGWSPSIRGVGGLGTKESANQVMQNLSQISPLRSGESEGNVHSGAPPPWFERSEENEINGQVGTGLHKNDIVSSSKKNGKSQKLNPNRVGAAWAEKRKIELEMEKRGETVTNSCDANWLPNFGRVWQSGSRRESRKEFQMESEKSLKTNSLSETPIKLQPYISKRMRRESGDG